MRNLTRPKPPESRRAVGDLIAGLIGGETVTRAYYDEPELSVVAVLEATGTPAEHLMTFATTSLHPTPNLVEQGDVRIELILVTDDRMEWGGEIVATSAMNIAKSGWPAAPEIVFPGIVSEFERATTTPHIMWDAPFSFVGLSSLSPTELEHPIYPLQGMPITDREWTFLKREGYQSLADRLERADAAYWDFQRESVC